MQKATKRQVEARAQELGVAIDDNELCRRLYADAPKGQVFSSTFTHCVVADHGEECGPKAEAWGSILDDLGMGVEPCDTDDCDVCADA